MNTKQRKLQQDLVEACKLQVDIKLGRKKGDVVDLKTTIDLLERNDEICEICANYCRRILGEPTTS